MASLGIPDFTNSGLLDEAADRIEELESALQDIVRHPAGLYEEQLDIADAALGSAALKKDAG